jgi:hypothetical protein
MHGTKHATDVRHDEAACAALQRRQREANADQALVTCHGGARRRRRRHSPHQGARGGVLVAGGRAAAGPSVGGGGEPEVLADGVAAVGVEEFDDALHAHVALAVPLSACTRVCEAQAAHSQ